MGYSWDIHGILKKLMILIMITNFTNTMVSDGSSCSLSWDIHGIFIELEIDVSHGVGSGVLGENLGEGLVKMAHDGQYL